MPQQSTRHILMMEPVDFYSNPQTMQTNAYQVESPESSEEIQAKALQEFRNFRDLLVDHGVIVTTVVGMNGHPDDIFPNNWISTHGSRTMVIYPMLHYNRREERRENLINALRPYYTDVYRFEALEADNQALESTGALCMDRANKIAYLAKSPRANEDAARKWADTMKYTLIPFDTEDRGKPVYHTDVVMWIGTEVAGICSECLKNKDVVKHLKHKRDVIEFSSTQMAAFCGNSLEVLGAGNERMLVMSKAGYNTLEQGQLDQLAQYYKTIIQADIPTIEKYGGGSARCMLLEMF